MRFTYLRTRVARHWPHLLLTGTPGGIILATVLFALSAVSALAAPAFSVGVTHINGLPMLGFGDQPVGTTSPPQYITITNTGDTPLDLGARGPFQTGEFGFFGPGSSTFGEVLEIQGTAYFMPGSGWRIEVTYTPNGPGGDVDGVYFFSSRIPDYFYTVHCVGNGVTSNPGNGSGTGNGTGTTPDPAPAARVSPASLDFGEQPLGTTSAPQTVTITNTGTAPLTLSSLISIVALDTSNFAITSDSGGVTMAPGQSRNLSITFTPTAAGSRQASLSFDSNAAGSPHSVSLKGTGRAAPAPPSPPLPISTTVALAGFTITPSSVRGGGYYGIATGTVTLTGPAPAGGAEVKLEPVRSDPLLAQLSSSVTVPAGARSAEFPIYTNAVDSERSYTVRSVYGGVSKEATLQILPAASLKITDVRMISPSELAVSTTRNFGDAVYDVSLSMQIEGERIVVERPLGSTPAQGADPESFVIDLKAKGVDRFTKNTSFTIAASASQGGIAQAKDQRHVVILLPVVLVPGIFAGQGGDGQAQLRGLEASLKAQSAQQLLREAKLGEGYRQEGESSYPTLYTLPYDTTGASLNEGADQLEELVKSIVGATYADKVNIVGYSKGGLVSRRFVLAHPSVVRSLTMVQTPNRGSLHTQAFPPAGVLLGVSNLRPLWPWHRSSPDDPAFSLPAAYGNAELELLNSAPMPAGVEYSIIWSDAFDTPTTITDLPLPAFGYTGGDGIEPAFSQLGLLYDPNHPEPLSTLFDQGRYISAFQGIDLFTLNVPGHHFGYTDNPQVQSATFGLVWGKL
jgi:pimeloyl-ACP methyl ester carboxylesterase